MIALIFIFNILKFKQNAQFFILI